MEIIQDRVSIDYLVNIYYFEVGAIQLVSGEYCR
jgi:hypothetical protein